MDSDRELARLRWRCRRGMREIDLLLMHYLDHAYDAADARQRAAFRALLEQPDPVLLGWLTGRDAPTDDATADVVASIRARA